MDFLTYRGILGDIGTIESNSTFYSDSSTMTSGVGAGTEIMNNLVIGGDKQGTSSNSKFLDGCGHGSYRIIKLKEKLGTTIEVEESHFSGAEAKIIEVILKKISKKILTI